MICMEKAPWENLLLSTALHYLNVAFTKIALWSKYFPNPGKVWDMTVVKKAWYDQEHCLFNKMTVEPFCPKILTIEIRILLQSKLGFQVKQSLINCKEFGNDYSVHLRTLKMI